MIMLAGRSATVKFPKTKVVYDACSLTTKIKVRLIGVPPVEAHAHSCVHSGTNKNIYFKNILIWSSIFAPANT